MANQEPTEQEWRELAQQAARTRRPINMIAFVKQSIAKLYEALRRKRASAESNEV